MAFELARRWAAPLADRSYWLALGLGALSVLAWAPFYWAPLLWLTLGIFYCLAKAAPSLRRAAVLGLIFGMGLFLGGVSWVYVSLSVFGGLPPALAAVSTFLYCLLLAAFPALAMAVFARWRSGSGWANVLLFAAVWATADWLRGWVFTGFPWLALGYTQTPGGWLAAPLGGYAPLLGVYGVSALVALLGASVGELIARRRPGKPPKVAFDRFFCKSTLIALTALLLSGGVMLSRVSWTEPTGAPIQVALLQGNIDQDMKWSPSRFEDSLQAYHELMLRHPAQLTILPETALPTFYDQLPRGYLRALTQLARRQNGDVVIGSVDGDNKRYTNSVISLGVASEQRYDKAHLVPFGEYPPPGFAWFMRLLSIPMSGFAPGGPVQAPFALSGQLVAFNICYEDVFGEELLGALPAATLLVNLSNTAWFGDSLAQPQHLQIAQLRAIETGRVMLRATNTGMTAFIRPDGTVQSVLSPFTRGALVAEVQGMSGLTPFARWKNFAALLLIVLFSLPALVACRKSR